MNLINQSELLGLGNLPASAPAKKEVKAAMRTKSGTISTKGATGKAMYEKLLHLLPPDIQKAVKSGQLQLVDEILYSVKKIGGFRDHELMESGDNRCRFIPSTNFHLQTKNVIFAPRNLTSNMHITPQHIIQNRLLLSLEKVANS